MSYDHILITGDFNSKIPVWGGTIENEHGRQLMELILSKRLLIINEEDSLPTFDGSRGNSWVDLTICDPNFHNSIFQWKVDIEPTGSDHNSISFTLYSEKSKYRLQRRLNCNKINISKLRSSLARDLSERRLPPQADLDNEINIVISIITAACL
ncbi:hypothetical protein AVEN_114631-1 [Araneus ventricosus]|uniref:Endonuclease/exonuclease/phosphatase domain-containing protein n=1 Tax=Araneus ventricosus TaxID=182803 RepID=A0A4Y2GBH6_ARAVE|nr:hypothetical protein AVEN_114631-1 [Araneus ventricosus]